MVIATLRAAQLREGHDAKLLGATEATRPVTLSLVSAVRVHCKTAAPTMSEMGHEANNVRRLKPARSRGCKSLAMKE